jgi:hypothetical protein
MLAAGLTTMEFDRVAEKILDTVRRKLAPGIVVALLLSFFLHGLVILSPAWRVPDMDGLFGDESPRIEAHLRPPAPPAPVTRRVRHRQSAPAPASAPTPTPATPVVDAPAVNNTDAPPMIADNSPPPNEPAPATEPEMLPAAIPESPISLPHRGKIRFSVSRGPDGFVLGQTTHEWHHDNLYDDRHHRNHRPCRLVSPGQDRADQ